MNYKSTFIDMKGANMAHWNDTSGAFVAVSFEMEKQVFWSTCLDNFFSALTAPFVIDLYIPVHTLFFTFVK